MNCVKRKYCKIGFAVSFLFSLIFIFTMFFTSSTSKSNRNYSTALTANDDNELDDGNEPRCNLITTSRISSAMGNQMFQYATLYGLAKSNNKKPFIRDHLIALTRTFNLSIPYEDHDLTSFVRHYERGNMFYDENSSRWPCNENSSILGFRQTYKYFEKFKSKIKAEFTFRDNISTICNNAINEAVQKVNLKLGRRNCFIVSAHIRRGDFLSNISKDAGFVVPDAAYILNAINYFESRFSRRYTCLQFLILGNDYEWNLANVPNRNNVLVLKTNTAEVDLCILSRCNGSIVSTGTYGWWGAYLASGPTVYMKEQCRPNSRLCKLYNMPDYAGSDWDWVSM